MTYFEIVLSFHLRGLGWDGDQVVPGVPGCELVGVAVGPLGRPFTCEPW